MLQQIDVLIAHHIGLIARWAVPFGAVIIVLCLLGVWRLGRRQRALIPATWPRRVASVALVILLAFSSLIVVQLLKWQSSASFKTWNRIDAAVGRPLPEMTFRLVADDSVHRLDDFHNKVVVLNLWGTWCPPCLHELPTLNALQSSTARDGVVVVSLSDEPRADLLAFAAKHPLASVNAYVEHFIPQIDAQGMRPITLVIDRSGVVRQYVIGPRSSEEFAALVHPYL